MSKHGKKRKTRKRFLVKKGHAEITETTEINEIPSAYFCDFCVTLLSDGAASAKPNLFVGCRVVTEEDRCQITETTEINKSLLRISAISA